MELGSARELREEVVITFSHSSSTGNLTSWTNNMLELGPVPHSLEERRLLGAVGDRGPA